MAQAHLQGLPFVIGAAEGFLRLSHITCVPGHDALQHLQPQVPGYGHVLMFFADEDCVGGRWRHDGHQATLALQHLQPHVRVRNVDGLFQSLRAGSAIGVWVPDKR